jgi:hypothetical protein
LTALGQYESGNNYSFVSSLGYLGRFQFAEEALTDVGFYTPDGSGNMNDFVGSFTPWAAATYGVTDKYSFLQSPAAQDDAVQKWFAKIISDVKMLGLEKYLGQTVGGIQITTSGLIAGTHLVGVWNLRSFLESNGANVPQDGYGTTVANYVGRFADYDTPFSLDGGGGGASGGGTTGGETPSPEPAAAPAIAAGGTPVLAIAAAGGHQEGDAGATDFTFTVTRSGDVSGGSLVDYYVWSDQTDSADFAGGLGGTARFGAGESQAVIRVQVAGDAAVEANETFHVSLSNARGATIETGQADGVILNDDGAAASAPSGDTGAGSGSATLSIGDAGRQAEGSEFVFNLTRAGDTSAPALVDYYTWSEQAGPEDFSGAVTGTARFSAGQTETQVRIATVNDAAAGGDELFHVALSNARGATIAVGQADAWILG